MRYSRFFAAREFSLISPGQCTMFGPQHCFPQHWRTSFTWQILVIVKELLSNVFRGIWRKTSNSQWVDLDGELPLWAFCLGSACWSVLDCNLARRCSCIMLCHLTELDSHQIQWSLSTRWSLRRIGACIAGFLCYHVHHYSQAHIPVKSGGLWNIPTAFRCYCACEVHQG